MWSAVPENNYRPTLGTITGVKNGEVENHKTHTGIRYTHADIETEIDGDRSNVLTTQL